MTSQKTKPLVSVAIPFLNGGEYFEKCLESVQNQNYIIRKFRFHEYLAGVITKNKISKLVFRLLNKMLAPLGKK